MNTDNFPARALQLMDRARERGLTVTDTSNDGARLIRQFEIGSPDPGEDTKLWLTITTAKRGSVAITRYNPGRMVRGKYAPVERRLTQANARNWIDMLGDALDRAKQRQFDQAATKIADAMRAESLPAAAVETPPVPRLNKTLRVTLRMATSHALHRNTRNAILGAMVRAGLATADRHLTDLGRAARAALVGS